MSSDNQFTALGPAIIGFQTNSNSIDVGADITGNKRGITGRCGSASGGFVPFGAGVAGFGLNTPAGTVAGTGVLGVGGTAAATPAVGAPGVTGIGGGGPNTRDPFGRAVGVYGQGGPGGPGVVGQAGPEFNAPGVEGFGTGGSFGVGGVGGSDSSGDGGGLLGVGGGTTGVGVVGIGGGAPLNVPSNPLGVLGQGGGTTGVGVVGIGGGASLKVPSNPLGVLGQGGGTTGLGLVGVGAGAQQPVNLPSIPIGVFGQSGPGGDGVQGVGSGGIGAGVHGISPDADGNGVIGEANNGPRAFGVWGRSSSGFAGFFDGAVQVNGSLSVTGFAQFQGGKQGFLVEEFVNASETVLRRGDLLSLHRTEAKEKFGDRIPIPHVELASEAYAVGVCGVVEGATSKSEHGRQDAISPEVCPGARGLMVTIGCYADCKVDAAVAPIEVGDLLTASSTPGHAQKVLDRSRAVGAIVGKALKAVEKGKTTIPILVLLH